MPTYDSAANKPEAEQTEGGKTPSGQRGDNPSTAGPGPTYVTSSTPENKSGHLNPSAPEDPNITPGSMTQK